MMSRDTLLPWAAAAGIAAAAVLPTAPRAASSRSRAAVAVQELEAVRRDAETLADSDQGPAPAGPSEGLAARLTACLRSCSLPTGMLSGVMPEPDSPTSTSKSAIVRRRARVSLEGPSLPQIGHFLAAWRRQTPEWCVSSIDLAPVAGPTGTGADTPLRVQMMIESLTLRTESSQP
ncbi:MAG: hypothetical protein DYG92_08445 [Leptolyngbya sp. PLA1]|nr:hypothetical protein [Leptolyngbya sp. PLA1]